VEILIDKENDKMNKAKVVGFSNEKEMKMVT
jgi:hypothetical protein